MMENKREHRRVRPFILRLVMLALFSPALDLANGVGANELSGFIEGQARLFANSATHLGQADQTVSLAAQPEYFHEWETGSSFTFVPFYRLDRADSKRTHFDVRELTFLYLHDDFELRLGVRKEFWGVTEVLHLVNIINQVDFIEDIDFEDFLGQPMANLSIARDWGTLDLFYLPFFRERTFPGRSGRLRGSRVVDTGRAVFESSRGKWHPDWTVRYSHTLGGWDLGIYHFNGTGREPTLLPGKNDNGNPVLIPFYEQINQTGVDVSYVTGSWLWKLEALQRFGQGKRFVAWTGGFEYTFTGIMETAMDLGVLAEWMYDERGKKAFTPFDNDIAYGLRLTFNDVDSTDLLFGWVQDVRNSARFLFLEASRRFSDHWKASLEIRTFFSQPADDTFFSLRNDDLMQLELAYFF